MDSGFILPTFSKAFLEGFKPGQKPKILLPIPKESISFFSTKTNILTLLFILHLPIKRRIVRYWQSNIQYNEKYIIGLLMLICCGLINKNMMAQKEANYDEAKIPEL